MLLTAGTTTMFKSINIFFLMERKPTVILIILMRLDQFIMSFDDTSWLWMIIFMNSLFACFEVKNFASSNN